MSEYKKVLLKKFGIISVNEIVNGYRVGNLWYVYIFGDWHYVPECDAEEVI